ncbi:GTPase-activating protein [Dinochytrium kinnereticum]|nr:GTPase-activating protein [Dinochytrium kinnereticum]
MDCLSVLVPRSSSSALPVANLLSSNDNDDDGLTRKGNAAASVRRSASASVLQASYAQSLPPGSLSDQASDSSAPSTFVTARRHTTAATLRRPSFQAQRPNLGLDANSNSAGGRYSAASSSTLRTLGSRRSSALDARHQRWPNPSAHTQSIPGESSLTISVDSRDPVMSPPPSNEFEPVIDSPSTPLSMSKQTTLDEQRMSQASKQALDENSVLGSDSPPRTAPPPPPSNALAAHLNNVSQSPNAPQQSAPRSSLGGFLWGRRSMSTSSALTASSTPRGSISSGPTLDPIASESMVTSPHSANNGPTRNSPTLGYEENGYASDEDGSSQFILARIEQQSPQHAGSQGSGGSVGPGSGREGKSLSTFEAFTSQLRLSFASVRESVTGSSAAPAVAGDSSDGTEDIDWDFWGKVMNNYEDIARRQSRLLTKKLQHGIPDAIRGMVWQLMSKSKDTELEATYRALLTRTSPHEKIIQRDLARTFPKHEHFSTTGPGSGQESLFNVIRAYSVYDSEVGYCQGIAFIAGPLLLNMPDEEAFCVLVKLMYNYNFRELFTPHMAGLQLRLFQFDKLLEEMLPNISKHLQSQDIKSNMYASQWFMTMFAYRFPLDMVFRIMDIIFAEGFEAMFRFALALLKRNTDVLLSLEFEQLLEFLKVGLFDIYIGNINGLIQHASVIPISKPKLDRMATEHAEEVRRNDPELITVDQLKSENRRLQDNLRKLEAGYETLNREHIDLAKEHLEAADAAERAQLRVEELQLQVEGLKSVLTEERLQAEAVVKEEMDRLARKNLELTAKNAELQDGVDRLEEMLAAEKRKLAESEMKRDELQGRWDGLRAALR